MDGTKDRDVAVAQQPPYPGGPTQPGQQPGQPHDPNKHDPSKHEHEHEPGKHDPSKPHDPNDPKPRPGDDGSRQR